MSEQALIKKESKEVAHKPQINFGGSIPTGGLVPTNFEGIYRLSEIFAKSGLMPKGFEAPEKVFVAITMGLEVGLYPTQAVQNICVINGRPSLWGDGMLAVIQASGLLEHFSETYEGKYPENDFKAVCIVKRKGGGTFRNEFSVAMAKKAGLWSKTGPWTQYPERMLKMRARAFTLRDGFADVLRGLRSAEEVMDFDVALTPNLNGVYEAPAEVVTEQAQNKPEVDTEPEIKEPEASTPPTETKGPMNVFTPDIESVLEPTPEPEEAKQPETMDNDGQIWERSNWKNFKKGKEGLSTFVYQNKAKLSKAPAEILQELGEKWAACYEEVPFPLAALTEPEQQPTTGPDKEASRKLVAKITKAIDDAQSKDELKHILKQVQEDCKDRLTEGDYNGITSLLTSSIDFYA